MNSIINLLDIYLITYNRSNHLKKTLEQLFAENSPIKDFEITIVDNNSADDTADIIKSYQEKFPNLKYRKNKYNIGGNGNIARTYELAQKKYVWILCDNDNYNWENWEEVIKAIKDDNDAIFVAKHDRPTIDIAQQFVQSTFVPAVIYKTSLIDDNLIQNMQFNLSNMFPHLVLAAKVINENKQIYIIQKPIVIPGENNTGDKLDPEGYLRGVEDAHPIMKKMNWLAGYANSVCMIKSLKIRNYIISHNMFYIPPLNSAFFFFYNGIKYKNSFYNKACVYNCLNLWNKFKFIINYILYLTLYQLLFIYSIFKYNENAYDPDSGELVKQYKIIIFGRIKTNLFKIKVKQGSK